MFLAVLKLPQSNLVVKNIAEVGAAGRYITVPSGVTKANHAFMHAFPGVLYIPTAWVSILFCSLYRLSQGLNGGQAEARYPAFLL